MNIYSIKMKKNTFLKHSDEIVSTSLYLEGSYIYFKTDINTKKFFDKEKIKYELQTDMKKRRHLVLINLNLVFLFFIFLLLVYINSFRISSIKFSKETPINQEIEAIIDENFTKLLWFNFIDIDYEQLSQDLRQAHSSYEWIEVRKVGSIINVAINETKHIENVNEKVGNIVSKVDGIVKEIRVYKGIPLVKEGDLIKKGDILIDGITDNVSAKGLILAESFYEEEAYIPKKEEVLKESGNMQKYKLFNLFGHEFKLTKELPFTNYKRDVKILFNFFNFFKLYQIEDRQLYDIIVTNDYNTSYKKALDEVLTRLQTNIEEESILSSDLLLANEDETSFYYRFLIKKLTSAGYFDQFEKEVN